MNILTEAVKVTKLQELHYFNFLTLIIINNLYPLLAQPTVIRNKKQWLLILLSKLNKNVYISSL